MKPHLTINISNTIDFRAATRLSNRRFRGINANICLAYLTKIDGHAYSNLLTELHHLVYCLPSTYYGDYRKGNPAH
jgi:hypothetical protein